MDALTMGQRIAELRARLNISQSELARRCGFGSKGRARVSNWENGRFRPEVETLSLLAGVLQCSVDDLLQPAGSPLGLTEPPDLRTPVVNTVLTPVPDGTMAQEVALTREELLEAVSGLAKSTAGAILHQEQEFVGQMRVIGDQLTAMGDAIEKRDEHQAERDAQTTSILQHLASVIERNTAIIEKQGKVIEQLQDRLDDTADLAGEEDDGTNGPTRGRR